MTPSNRWFLLSSMLCAVLASLVFLPGHHGGFVFDDRANIIDNPVVHMTELSARSLFQVAFGLQPGGTTRVLPTLSFALDYWRAGGPDPSAFKATNIVIHAVTTLALAWFFRTLLQVAGVARRSAPIAALVLALAWALHPLQVSSVLYVVQRMQTLCTLFLVLALLMYLQARQAQIEGRSGRTGCLLTVLFWILAAGSKEDAILLPMYMVSLELTVLGFRAHDPKLAVMLRKSYAAATTAAAAIFLFVVLPHFWHWDNYPERDFSSYQRLLTQGRVLCMYLWEILLPLPRHMPFYYDWIQPSRSLLHPWTTLPALSLLAALVALAWQLRIKRPVFALGVFLFLSGHFLTSNVIGLELAFEHRNQFPLIGIVLALGDLLAMTWRRLTIRPALGFACCTLPLVLMGGATAARSNDWRNPLALAVKSTELAPHSARAWNSRCLYYYRLGGAEAPDNPYLDTAIDICGQGAIAAPYSVTSLVNLVVFKTKRGTVAQKDWDALIDRLRLVNMNPENKHTAQVLMYNASSGVALNEDNLLESLDIISNRASLGMNELATIGYFIISHTHRTDQAYGYFAKAIALGDPSEAHALIEAISPGLVEYGRPGWVAKLKSMADAKSLPRAVN